MGRPAKPVRLWLRKIRGGQSQVWVICDHGKQISTGAKDRASAEKKLAEYLMGWRLNEQDGERLTELGQVAKLISRDVRRQIESLRAEIAELKKRPGIISLHGDPCATACAMTRPFLQNKTKTKLPQWKQIDENHQ